MTSGEERLHSVTIEEHEVFVTDCRHLYLEVAGKLASTAKVDSAVVFIANAPAKKYVEICQKILQEHEVILMAGRGSELKKLVSVVEQVKQTSKGRISQMNKLFRQPSLINPSYAAQHSTKNVQIFFGDEISGNSAPEAALKEIKGHKVYDVPCMAVVLTKGEAEVAKSAFPEWSVQVKGQ